MSRRERLGDDNLSIFDGGQILTLNTRRDADDSRASSTTRKRSSFPIHIMPDWSPSRNFVGRDQVIQSIKSALTPPAPVHMGGDLKTFALYGPAGIGKSEVACKFAWECKDMYDALFWVNAHSSQTLQGNFNEIAVRLGVFQTQDNNSTAAVKDWLARPERPSQDRDERSEAASWLIIFDGLNEPRELDNLYLRTSLVPYLLRVGMHPQQRFDLSAAKECTLLV